LSKYYYRVIVPEEDKSLSSLINCPPVFCYNLIHDFEELLDFKIFNNPAINDIEKFVERYPCKLLFDDGVRYILKSKNILQNLVLNLVDKSSTDPLRVIGNLNLILSDPSVNKLRLDLRGVPRSNFSPVTAKGFLEFVNSSLQTSTL
jgi:hypothetical protein